MQYKILFTQPFDRLFSLDGNSFIIPTRLMYLCNKLLFCFQPKEGRLVANMSGPRDLQHSTESLRKLIFSLLLVLRLIKCGHTCTYNTDFI